MDVFIFPLDNKGSASFHLKTVEHRGDHPTYWAFTDTGYLDSDTWVPILEKLQERMAIIAPGIRPVLLVDNLSVHKCDEALKYCFDHGMYAAFFPSNTTHFLQPEDDLMFANFKRKLYTLLEEELVTVTAKDRSTLGKLLVQV